MNDDAYERLATDPDLGPVVDRHGRLALDPADDLFERLVQSICRQQVSMDAAAAIEARLVDAVDLTPDAILAADETTLRDAGLSSQKVRYVTNVAETFQREGYDHATFADMPDDAVVDELTAITGVGEWTANMQLIFALGREDVFPVGDLGVRKGMASLFDLDVDDRQAMTGVAERWAPYRTYATLYCWRHVEDPDDDVPEVVDG
jgi:DNA-3-methyladenine glycosylase II